MKKIGVLFAAFILVLTLSACQNNNDPAVLVISGIQDVTVTVGERINVLEGVTASDGDRDLTNDIIVSSICNIDSDGILDTNMTGICDVEYTLDHEAFTTPVTATFTIQEITQTTSEYTFVGLLDKTVSVGDIVRLLDGVTVEDEQGNVFSDISVSSSNCPIILNQLNTQQAETCIINYTFNNGETHINESITIVVEPVAITVYFEAPDDFSDAVSIYFYNVDEAFLVDWDNAPLMEELDSYPGWYVYTFDKAVEQATVMFKDDQGNQTPGSGESGIVISETTWFTSDVTINSTESLFPESYNEGEPLITVTPTSSTFSDTLMVDVVIKTESSLIDQFYTLNGTDIDFEGTNTTLDLGSDFYTTQRVELMITATNDIGTTTTRTYIYIKDYPTSYEPLNEIREFNDLRIYQIYVAAFQDGDPVGYDMGYGPSDHDGDLQGIIDSLDYIASLNVNAIWLTPIFESYASSSYSEWETRGRSTGYFADDYFNIDPEFGTNELFRVLVDEAHDRGLYVFLDGVFGHHGSYPIEGVLDGADQWYGSEVVYPESLEYFIDVATYWIEEYNIDGWRLDQSYQLYQDNYNYLRDIRIAVETVSAERAARGEEWGILGYMVAEVWNSNAYIQDKAYDMNAVRSAFAFPLRYAIVGSIATTADYWNASFYDLDYAMDMLEVEYTEQAQPNAFITNHDMLRFGDLLQFAGKDDEYYERHKMAIGFLTAFSGPITIYYGDEWGAEYEGLNTSLSDLDSIGWIAADNVSRTSGKVSGFDEHQLDLIEYVSDLMALRDTYDSLAHGDRINLHTTASLYIDLKVSDQDSVIFGLNDLTTEQSYTVSTLSIGGTQVQNILTGEVISAVNGQITLTFDPISPTFYEVY